MATDQDKTSIRRPDEEPTIRSTADPLASAGQPVDSGTVLIPPQPPGPPSFAWFAVMSGSLIGQILRLDLAGSVVGTDARSELVLDDSTVSGLHAKVWAEGGDEDSPTFLIQDLASTNGTFINGEQVVKETLADGDRVRIGQTELVFKQV